MMLQMHGPLLPVLLLVLSTTTAAQSIQSSTVFRFGGQFEERAQVALCRLLGCKVGPPNNEDSAGTVVMGWSCLINSANRKVT